MVKAERGAWIDKLRFEVQPTERSAPSASSLHYSGPDLVDLNPEDPELGIGFSTASSLGEVPEFCC